MEGTTVEAGVAAVYRDDPRMQALIGPGGPFEVERVEVDGVVLRSFVKAPDSIIDCFRASRAYDDRVHLVFERERHTFGEVRRRAMGLAGALRAGFGVGPGDRVALALRNYPEFVVGFWGTALLGAVVVPVNAWWVGEELVYAIEDSGAKVVIADQERLEPLVDVSAARIAVRTPDPMRFGAAPFDEVAAGPPLAEESFAPTGPDDVVTILYTSGTTGRAKGALLTNRGTMANLMNMAFMAARANLLDGRAAPPPKQTATIAGAPLFHIGGIAGIVGGAMAGSKMVLMRKWSVGEAIALAQAEDVTGFGGVPAIARQILEYPGVGRLGLDVRSFPMGGASVAPDLPKKVVELFGESVNMFNGYGLTETTSAVVSNSGREYTLRPDSVGRPNLTADIKVEDPDGRILPAGQVGELCFRSPQVAKGYWHRPVDTAESFVGGWFHSGDLGYVDDEGFVYVVDRLKDVVIRGGENVYCAEVEAILFQHPGVADVSVVGIKEDALGERVCAVVVPRPGATIQLRDLRTFARPHLAPFKVPEALLLIDELPRTPTGKTDKRALRSDVEAAALADRVERAWPGSPLQRRDS